MCIAEVSSAKSARVASGSNRSLLLGNDGRFQPTDGDVFAPFRTDLLARTKKRGGSGRTVHVVGRVGVVRRVAVSSGLLCAELYDRRERFAMRWFGSSWQIDASAPGAAMHATRRIQRSPPSQVLAGSDEGVQKYDLQRPAHASMKRGPFASALNDVGGCRR